MEKIKLTFFGSPDFAAEFLEKLLTDASMYRYIEVKLVFTQPDKKVGRKQILTPTPVKQIANKYKINVFESGSMKKGIEAGHDDRSLMTDKNPTSKFQLPNPFPNQTSIIQDIDLALVYAYGDLIPKEFLSLPKYGFWNIHPSLLPKYRGPSPIAAPIINGDKTTGVTIIKMDEEIDHGPIIAQESLTIEKNDKRPDLEKKLTDLGFKMFKSILLSFPRTRESMTSGSPIRSGMTPTTQQHQLATYTKKLTKQDGFISIENLKLKIKNSPEVLYNLFRGLYPWPGLWTMVKPIQPTRLDEAKRLKITDLELINGKLIIQKVQLEGKNEVDFETFNEAYKIF